MLLVTVTWTLLRFLIKISNEFNDDFQNIYLVLENLIFKDSSIDSNKETFFLLFLMIEKMDLKF
jgi:hypothetical protein